MSFSEPREPIPVAVISAHPDDETFGAGGGPWRNMLHSEMIFMPVS